MLCCIHQGCVDALFAPPVRRDAVERPLATGDAPCWEMLCGSERMKRQGWIVPACCTVGRQRTVVELVEMFQEDAPLSMAAIREAIRQGNADQLHLSLPSLLLRHDRDIWEAPRL